MGGGAVKHATHRRGGLGHGADRKGGVKSPAQQAGADVLDLGRMLGRALDQHRAIFLWQCDRDLALEVEMILPADRDAAVARGRWGGAHERRSC